MYREAEKSKYFTSDDLVLSKKRTLMTQNGHVSYIYITTALVKLP